MDSQNLYSKCLKKLVEGRDKLGLSMGIVSHIEGEEYRIIAVSSLTNVFAAGESFALQDTYCRDVYKNKRTIALTEIDDCLGLQNHPLYDQLPLEAYISSPILVDGKVWGTINFSCMKTRKEPFSDADVQYVESMAESIANSIKE